MNTDEIIMHEVDRDRMRMVLDLLRECVGQPREATNGHPHRQVLALNVGRADMARIGVASGPLVCACACTSIVWPEKRWGITGYDPDTVLNDDCDSELEAIESMTIGYAESTADNSRDLRSAGWRMRLAFCLSLLGLMGGTIALLASLVAA